MHPAALLLATGLIVAVGPAAAESLYKWTDDDGNVHYSDSLPPEEAGARRKREVKSESGTTREVIEPPPTREELEAEQRRLEAEAAERRRREAREGRDRNLRLTFQDVGEIKEARDERIGLIDSQIRLLKERMNKLETRLERRRKAAARIERSGTGDAETVYREISELKRRQRRNRAMVDEKRAQQARIRADFAEDIERFRELVRQEAASQ